MRKIVIVKADNGTNINIIADVKKPEEARNLAAEHFDRLIRDKRLEITKSSKIVSSEDWEQSRVSSSQSGNKLYKALFYMNNVTQCVDISAVSVKSAYNNVKIKFGIEENLFMIIYDTTQNVKTKSAMETSLSIYNNKEEVAKVLKKAAEKIKETNGLGYYDDRAYLFINLIKDAYLGRYTKINDKNMKQLIACLIYFIEPYTTTQDIINIDKPLDDKGIIDMFINMSRYYIKDYKQTNSEKLKQA